MLAAQGTSLDAVLELTVDTDEVVQRLLTRAQVDGRADDTEDVIRHRLTVYDEETAPLAALYRERGLLHQVDGMGEMAEVAERIQTVLAALQS
jgi:adenylate kinase